MYGAETEYSITTQILSLNESKRLFHGTVDFDASHPECRHDSLSGVERWIPGRNLDDTVAVQVLFVRVPGVGPGILRQLASQEIWHINWASENLQSQASFAVFGPQVGGIYVPLRGTDSLKPDAATWTMRLALVGDGCVLYACHCLCDEALDDYLVGCQVVTASSGLHYDPARIHSQAELDAVAHREEEFLVTGRTVRLLHKP